MHASAMRWRTQGTPPQPGRARLGGGACTAVRSGGRFPPGPAEQLGEGVPERAPSRHGSGAQGGGEPEDGPAVAGPSSVSMKERGAEGGALPPTGQRPASWVGVQPAAGSCHAPVTSHRDAVRQRREYCSYGGCRVGGAVLGYTRLSSLNKEGGALDVRVAAIDQSTVAEKGAPFYLSKTTHPKSFDDDSATSTGHETSVCLGEALGFGVTSRLGAPASGTLAGQPRGLSPQRAESPRGS